MLGNKLKIYAGAAVMALMAGAFVDFVSSASAAEIKRVRCRVSDNLQISVNVRDIGPGIDMAQVTIKNLSRDDATALPINGVVDAEGDAQVEWDSDPDVGDPAEGQRASIAGTFAGEGDTVQAMVLGLEKTANCVAKN